MNRIAFYAPIKPPDHAIPSGDRQMARMLMSALKRAGYDVFLASRFISYSKRWSAEEMEKRKAAARSEAERLVGEWRSDSAIPDLWFCYHPYDKSPDWLGLEIAERLGLPMIAAEPCKTGQGPNGEWLPWRAEAQRSIRAAAMNLVMKPSDHEYVSGLVEPSRIARLDPFIDLGLLESESGAAHGVWPEGEARLLSVGMMRPGAKQRSYSFLLESLSRIESNGWSLAVAGGGPLRGEIESAFSERFGERVRFLGECSPERIVALMDEADILAWPGCGEAYGMAYLEAAARGLPSAALREAGVPLVVRHEETGLLADSAEPDEYANLLSRLVGDSSLRLALGEGARRFAHAEAGVERAASRLKQIIDSIPTRTRTRPQP